MKIFILLLILESKFYILNLGHVGRTFQSKDFQSKIEVGNDLFVEGKYRHREQLGFDENRNEYKYGHWCYDTPGTIQPDQVLDLLTMQELLSVLPKKIISPRTFILHINETIFLGGIGRLDYVEGESYIRYSYKLIIVFLQ